MKKKDILHLIKITINNKFKIQNRKLIKKIIRKLDRETKNIKKKKIYWNNFRRKIKKRKKGTIFSKSQMIKTSTLYYKQETQIMTQS